MKGFVFPIDPDKVVREVRKDIENWMWKNPSHIVDPFSEPRWFWVTECNLKRVMPFWKIDSHDAVTVLNSKSYQVSWLDTFGDLRSLRQNVFE